MKGIDFNPRAGTGRPQSHLSHRAVTRGTNPLYRRGWGPPGRTLGVGLRVPSPGTPAPAPPVAPPARGWTPCYPEEQAVSLPDRDVGGWCVVPRRMGPWGRSRPGRTPLPSVARRRGVYLSGSSRQNERTTLDPRTPEGDSPYLRSWRGTIDGLKGWDVPFLRDQTPYPLSGNRVRDNRRKDGSGHSSSRA